MRNTDYARALVETVANKYIIVDNKWEGRDEQRKCYLKARRMLETLRKEYREWCIKMYKGKVNEL